MYLSHVNITMPRGQEAEARLFYGGYLGLRELPKPEAFRARGGVWFEAGGLHLHLSEREAPPRPNEQDHFGLGCGDVEGLRARLRAAGVVIEDAPPSPCKRFFIRDPFGNRIEIHQPAGARA